MDELNTNMPANSGEHEDVLPGTDTGGQAGSGPEAAGVTQNTSRRDFLHGSARKLAYAAPLILLFHPKPACASNGSTLTYWDVGSGSIKHKP